MYNERDASSRDPAKRRKDERSLATIAVLSLSILRVQPDKQRSGEAALWRRKGSVKIKYIPCSYRCHSRFASIERCCARTTDVQQYVS
jgi:hypothetical protein